METVRTFEVGRSAYYVKDGSTVCRGKVLARRVGPSYQIRGASEPILCSEVFASADEARASIVPKSWWRGNGNNEH